MRKTVLGALAGLALSACAQPTPYGGATLPAGQGAVRGGYAAYELERAQREAQLTGAAPGAFAPPLLPPAPASAAVTPSGISSTDLAAAGIGTSALPGVGASPGASGSVPATPATATSLPGPLPAPVPSLPATVPGDAGAAPAPLGAAQITPGTPATASAQPAWNPAADPLRPTGLEARPGNAAPVLVGALPVAPATDAGPNIVEYALSAPNARGQEWYSRFAFSGEGRASRNCAEYRSPDEAQRDFLLRGGPERDARGIDPDGDGFACGWDPAPFRAAVGG